MDDVECYEYCPILYVDRNTFFRVYNFQNLVQVHGTILIADGTICTVVTSSVCYCFSLQSTLLI